MGKLFRGDKMKKDRKFPDDLRVNPEEVLNHKFDQTSIAMFPVAEPEEMGMRILDNCAEEHIM